jgi:predicted amidohydrolase
MSITRDGKLHALDTPYGRLSSVICYDADFPRLLAQAGDLRADIRSRPFQRLEGDRPVAYADGELPRD